MVSEVTRVLLFNKNFLYIMDFRTRTSVLTPLFLSEEFVYQLLVWMDMLWRWWLLAFLRLKIVIFVLDKELIYFSFSLLFQTGKTGSARLGQDSAPESILEAHYLHLAACRCYSFICKYAEFGLCRDSPWTAIRIWYES